MVTLKMSRWLLNHIGKVYIGWTSTEVRERPLARCYRCHGFGHTSVTCRGPDLIGTCRKCGIGGHLEKECTTTDKTCVACERAGLKMEPRVLVVARPDGLQPDRLLVTEIVVESIKLVKLAIVSRRAPLQSLSSKACYWHCEGRREGSWPPTPIKRCCI